MRTIVVADARRLVAEAGFGDVSIAYADINGFSPNGFSPPIRALDRLAKVEDMHIVKGTKAR